MSNLEPLDLSQATPLQPGLPGQFSTYENPPSVWPAFLMGQEASPVRVLLIDDDPHIRRVIAQELMADPRTLLVAQACSVREGRRAIRQHCHQRRLHRLHVLRRRLPVRGAESRP